MFIPNFSEIDQSKRGGGGGGAVAPALFSLRHPKNFENEKIFLCLKIAKIDIGGQFWLKGNDFGHKNSFF